MRGVRGQVTAFVLIGLALLIVLLILLLLRAALLSQHQPLTGEQQKQVRQSVAQCLDLVTTDALQKLASQGGRLYESQDGLTPDATPFAVMVKEATANGAGAAATRVGFALINDSGVPVRPPTISFFNTHSSNYGFDPSLENPYPWPGLSLDELTLDATRQQTSPLHPWALPGVDGPYGQLVLPGLCQLGGVNGLLSSEYRCPPSLFPNPLLKQPSVQESLDRFITSRITRCLDIDTLATKLGTEVTAEAPNATVSFTPTETVVTLSWPLRFSNAEGSTQFFTFTRRYPVRLVPLFAFARELFSRASKDPYFRLNDSTEYNTLRHQDGFSVRQERLASDRAGGRADLFLVTITDAKSILEGGAYSASFLLQDRRPILDVIQSPYTLTPFLSFEALDPDGDALTATVNPLGSSPPTTEQPCQTNPHKLSLCQFFSLGEAVYQVSVSDGSLSDWQVVDFTTPSSN